MTIFSCINMGDAVTSYVESPAGRAAIAATTGDRGAATLGLIRETLDPEEQYLWDAEYEALSPAMIRTVAQLIVRAVDENIPFFFASRAPASVIEYARDRKIEFQFSLEEGRIQVELRHTHRHPSWLPAPPRVEAVTR